MSNFAWLDTQVDVKSNDPWGGEILTVGNYLNNPDSSSLADGNIPNI